MPATLTKAWAMVSEPAHASLRHQVEMACWYVARDKKIANAHTPDSAAGQLVMRVLRGDAQPAELVVKALANTVATQEAYTAAGDKLTDAAVLAFVQSAWNTIAGL